MAAVIHHSHRLPGARAVVLPAAGLFQQYGLQRHGLQRHGRNLALKQGEQGGVS